MILLDTHIWVWWIEQNTRLSDGHRAFLRMYETEGLGVSVISCWEVAMLVERGRLGFRHNVSVNAWIDQAIRGPGIRVVGLSPEIAVASTQLPGSFHRDPADRIIVATARLRGTSLVTVDEKIVEYEHVETIDFRLP